MAYPTDHYIKLLDQATCKHNAVYVSLSNHGRLTCVHCEKVLDF